VKLKLKEGGRENEKGLEGGREKEMVSWRGKKYYDIGEKDSLSKNTACVCVWLSHSLSGVLHVHVCVRERERERERGSK
jgi:hypothetical protein